MRMRKEESILCFCVRMSFIWIAFCGADMDVGQV